MQKEVSRKDWFRPRSLFGKYVTSFVGLVVLVLAVNGGLETWFTYRQTTRTAGKAQSEKAEATARRIEQFVSEIERQISWATRASATTLEQRRSDYALLLQQVPAIDRVIQLDGAGKEQLRLTRGELVVASGIDYSGDPRFKAAQGQVRSGCRRSTSTGPTRSCRSRWRIPGETPVRPSPRSISSSCRVSRS